MCGCGQIKDTGNLVQTQFCRYRGRGVCDLPFQSQGAPMTPSLSSHDPLPELPWSGAEQAPVHLLVGSGEAGGTVGDAAGHMSAVL